MSTKGFKSIFCSPQLFSNEFDSSSEFEEMQVFGLAGCNVLADFQSCHWSLIYVFYIFLFGLASTIKLLPALALDAAVSSQGGLSYIISKRLQLSFCLFLLWVSFETKKNIRIVSKPCAGAHVELQALFLNLL